MFKELSRLQLELNRLYQLNDHQQLEDFFTDEVLSHVPGCCSVSNEYIYLMNEAGSYYRSIGQYPKAISFFQGLSRVMERFHLACTVDYASVLNNLAGCFRMAGSYQDAEETFHQAIAVYCAAGAQGTTEYASALNNLSLCYQATEQYDKALEYQQQALACCRTAGGSPEALAASLTNYASFCAAAGRAKDAFSSVAKAVSLLESSNLTHTPAYIGALHVEACLHGRESHLELALAEYERVLELAEKYLGRGIDYSAASKNAAMISHALGKSDLAVSYLTESLRIDRQILPTGHPRISNSEKLLSAYRKEVSL